MAKFPEWVKESPLTLRKVAWIASRHETDIAHAALHSVAVEMAAGRAAESPVGEGWADAAPAFGPTD
ncbi:MAG: hypothetical protein HFJ72_08410 [Adlercreutzia sp.]|nr:hypothetical protein [Adlercreutzia sp.]